MVKSIKHKHSARPIDAFQIESEDLDITTNKTIININENKALPILIKKVGWRYQVLTPKFKSCISNGICILGKIGQIKLYRYGQN